MKSFSELITEASHPGRASSGKLKKIDELMAWLYDKNILNKGEKKKKDSIFYKYYRWYNDGDKPRGKRYSGLYNDKEIAAELEKEIEEFIKQTLVKYLPKINRADFKFDMAISKLNRLIYVAEENDFYSLVNYYVKDVKDPKVLENIKILKGQLEHWKKIVPKEFNNIRASYAFSKMKTANELTPELKSSYKEMNKTIIDIHQDLLKIKKLMILAKDLE